MSKKETLARYSIIIKKVRKCPASFDEILDYLELESEIQGEHYQISKRTFQRDLDDIRSLYNIDIQYNFSRRVYYIASEPEAEMNQRIMEAFDTFNALNLTARLSRFIYFGRRHPSGTEHLYGLLHAIRNRRQLSFTYTKFWDGAKQNRMVEPYALKEFRDRWYLLANDLKDDKFKSFGLDRIDNLEISRYVFKRPKDLNLTKHFRYSFGIISPNGDQPEVVELKFDSLNGKYIKSLPLHHTQTIVKDDDKGVVIQLKLFVTYDFCMELLSYGDKVRVLQPNFLAQQMKQTYRSALEQYRDVVS